MSNSLLDWELNFKSNSEFAELFSFKHCSQKWIISFLNSEYKQFDGEKEYYNSVQHRNVTNMGFKPQKICNLRLKTNYLNISITVLKQMSICMLLNTCNFYCKFRFIFLLILSENVPNANFWEAKFLNFSGGCPRTPLAHSRLRRSTVF